MGNGDGLFSSRSGFGSESDIFKAMRSPFSNMPDDFGDFFDHLPLPSLQRNKKKQKNTATRGEKTVASSTTKGDRKTEGVADGGMARNGGEFLGKQRKSEEVMSMSSSFGPFPTAPAACKACRAQGYGTTEGSIGCFASRAGGERSMTSMALAATPDVITSAVKDKAKAKALCACDTTQREGLQLCFKEEKQEEKQEENVEEEKQGKKQEESLEEEKVE